MRAVQPAGPTPLTILFVCTGNICRSPMAERLTRAALARRGIGPAEVRVHSAGTYGLSGNSMHRHAVAALRGLDIDGVDFVARELSSTLVRDSDLVLTATREHRGAAVALHPPAAARTFTLGEFARLCDGLDPGALPIADVAARGRALVRAAAARRGVLPPVPADRDELADPLGGTAASFAQCAQTISAILRRPLDLLVPPS